MSIDEVSELDAEDKNRFTSTTFYMKGRRIRKEYNEFNTSNRNCSNMNNVIVDQDKINDGKFEIKKDILLSEKRR